MKTRELKSEISLKTKLKIVDTIEIDDSGLVTLWACASNGLGLTKETIGVCPAPENGCPRGFTESFECRTYGVDR